MNRARNAATPTFLDTGPLRLPLVAVLVVGLVLRIALLRATPGQDFRVWDLATRASLAGTNIYAHHPNYPGGPFAYFPLFIYLELPFQFLAVHGVASFAVLGKIPIAIADTACVLLLWRELRRRGLTPLRAGVGCGLCYLNPLVVYNSAYYGRFDALPGALLLWALLAASRERRDGLRSAVAYALAVAAKTYPVFLLPWFLRRRGGSRWRVLAVLAGVLLVVSVPYLTTPIPYLHDMIAYNLAKMPQGLSWLYLVDRSSPTEVALLGTVLLALFLAISVALRRVRDPSLYASAVLAAFLATNKVVLEQYLIWPLPFVIIVALCAPRPLARAALGLLSVSTCIGMLDNETFHPFGRQCPLAVVLAVSAAIYVAVVANHARLTTRQDVSDSEQIPTTTV